VLQSAGVDGFADGERAAWNMVQKYLVERRRAKQTQVSESGVSSSLSPIQDPQVYIGREVRVPGTYPWTKGMRLSNVIASAGGLTDFASRSIRVVHSDGTKEVFHYDRIIKKPVANPALRPGDRVNITSPIF
jgi:protein involved in polysaccharide export with SLBB domain